MSTGGAPKRSGFYEAAWIGYIFAVLGLTFGASQVAPDGWRRVLAALLILLAGALAAAAHHFERFRQFAIFLAILAVFSSLPIALLPSGKAEPKPSARNGEVADSLSANMPAVTIIEPTANAVVKPCATVTFKAAGPPPGMAFVLGISIPEHNAWHFTADGLAQVEPGVWSKIQSLGDAAYGKGAPFAIGVYVMKKSELDALSKNETDFWDPSVPPTDATRLASVSVVRNSRDLSC